MTLLQATGEQAELIRLLASKVWYKTYEYLDPHDKLDYMFEMMYAPDKIRKDCTGNSSYYILYDDEPVGYLSLMINGDTLVIQKIYIMPEAQSKGYGRFLLEETENFARKHKLQKLWLVVNRRNKARHFYERMGFSIVGERDFDIGEGHFMNDFIMEKSLQ
ncbi:MAG: GNAT family N-acetyltransferase [Prevotellaceae bacterium]|jgi:ribosomal protein S18 acetylase RimI-like enzyme|nr:GNAT family N-acetyltransferase [Prevotellaceae bacterium]